MLRDDTKEVMAMVWAAMPEQSKAMMAMRGPAALVDGLISKGRANGYDSEESDKGTREGFLNLVEYRDEAVAYTAGLMGMA